MSCVLASSRNNIFLNLTTKEAKDYTIELTQQGFKVGLWLLFCVNDNVSIIINHAVALFCYCSIEVIFSVFAVVFATLFEAH